MADLRRVKEQVARAAETLGKKQATLLLAQAEEGKRAKKKRDTRLVHIGIAVEQLVKGDDGLLTRLEVAVRAAFKGKKAALAAFGIGEDGPTWFDEVREDRLTQPATAEATSPASPPAGNQAQRQPAVGGGAATKPATGSAPGATPQRPASPSNGAANGAATATS